MTDQRLEAFMFMRVGNHAGESFEEILERKRVELENTGRIFWGYGGHTCHPLRQVQPFVRLHVRKQGAIYLLMEPIDSRANPEILPAKEYSDNGIDWLPIPDGIRVIGSRYALILDEIKSGELELSLGQYTVGVGLSRGKSAVDYLGGRVDKACLTRSSPEVVAAPQSARRLVRYSAKLLEPYAVLLR